MRILALFLCSRQKGDVDSLLDSQLSLLNEYEFCCLLYEWLYNINVLISILLKNYIRNNEVGKCLREPGKVVKACQWPVEGTLTLEKFGKTGICSTLTCSK